MVGHIALAPFGFDKLVSGMGCGPATFAPQSRIASALSRGFRPIEKAVSIFPALSRRSFSQVTDIKRVIRLRAIKNLYVWPGFSIIWMRHFQKVTAMKTEPIHIRPGLSLYKQPLTGKGGSRS